MQVVSSAGQMDCVQHKRDSCVVELSMEGAWVLIISLSMFSAVNGQQAPALQSDCHAKQLQAETIPTEGP